MRSSCSSALFPYSSWLCEKSRQDATEFFTFYSHIEKEAPSFNSNVFKDINKEITTFVDFFFSSYAVMNLNI